MRISLRALLVFVFVLPQVTFACSKGPATSTVPTASVPPPTSSASIATMPPPPPSSDPPPPPNVQLKPMSEWKAGDTVTARGKISTIMWQHMTQMVPGKKLGYFDVEGEKTQIVVYWKEAPKCTHLIEVTGKVIELRGHSKRPGEKESKVDESYSERHIDVESTRCVE